MNNNSPSLTSSHLQHCPICQQPVTRSSRYPDYICSNCIKLAADQHGRLVAFGNTAVLGYGCQGIYLDNQAAYMGNLCYIKGITCLAEEAYFGGIIVRPV